MTKPEECEKCISHQEDIKKLCKIIETLTNKINLMEEDYEPANKGYKGYRGYDD